MLLLHKKRFIWFSNWHIKCCTDIVRWNRLKTAPSARMQTKLPLENLIQTVRTRKRYEQSYNVAKCLYNVFVFFFVLLFEFWEGFKKIRRSWLSQSDYCTNFKLSMLVLRLYLFLAFVAFFSFNSIYSSFFTPKI